MKTSLMDRIVIDWSSSWPDSVDGIWTVEGITIDQYNALVDAQPDKRSGMLINALRVAGYKVEWIPKPDRSKLDDNQAEALRLSVAHLEQTRKLYKSIKLCDELLSACKLAQRIFKAIHDPADGDVGMTIAADAIDIAIAKAESRNG